MLAGGVIVVFGNWGLHVIETGGIESRTGFFGTRVVDLRGATCGVKVWLLLLIELLGVYWSLLVAV